MLKKNRATPATFDQKLAWSIDEATVIIGIGRSALYEEIKAGRLVAVKIGRRTVIRKADAERFLASLPHLGAAA